jgi:hypothetical protein
VTKFDFESQPELGTAMDWRVLEAITAPAVSNACAGRRSFCALTNQDLCIFSTVAPTALEKPVVVKTSRSIQRGDAVFFRYSVNPPSRLPFRLIRLKVILQFEPDEAAS